MSSFNNKMKLAKRVEFNVVKSYTCNAGDYDVQVSTTLDKGSLVRQLRRYYSRDIINLKVVENSEAKVMTNYSLSDVDHIIYIYEWNRTDNSGSGRQIYY